MTDKRWWLIRREPADYIDRMAHEMAKSGEFPSLEAIEIALFKQGYPQASEQLADPLLNDKLKELCTRAKAGKALREKTWRKSAKSRKLQSTPSFTR